MPRWLLVVAVVLGALLVIAFVLFGIGDEEPSADVPESKQVIDELRGAYRGVGLGDPAAEVRRAFGPAKDAGDGPFMPLEVESFVEAGGAMFIATPAGIPHTPRDPELLRYREVSFLLLDDQVFALMITDDGAATTRGVAIGDDLNGAAEQYDGLNCENAEVGSAISETFPFCAGRVAPRRHIWFGQDPIASITIATTGFGGYECSREQRLKRVRRGLDPRRCP